MADKSVGELIAAQSVTPTDLFVLEQNGTAKKLTGQILENWLVSFADGHGGIQSIVKIETNVLADTYRITLADTTTFDFVVTNGRGVNSITKKSTSGLVDTYTISYNDNTSETFTVTNGAKGDKGDNQYVWIKYASQKPTASSHSFGDVADNWIGVYSGASETAPTDWTQYEWFQIKGEKGDTGEAARLMSSAVEYQVSDSGTIIPSGVWSASMPVVAQGKYLWTRTTNTFNTGNPVVSYSVSRMGLDGSGSVSSVANISPDENGNVPLTAADLNALPNTGGDLTGELRMNGQPISGLNPPTESTQAANMGYVNAQVKKAAPWNLLDNSDFRNPVNQRGYIKWTQEAKPATGADANTYYGFTTGYTIDRWKTTNNNTSVEILDGSIKLTNKVVGSGGYVIQSMDNAESLLGKTLTLAVKIKNGRLLCASGKLPVSFPTSITQPFIVTDPITDTNIGDVLVLTNSIWCRILSGVNEDTRSFEWAALYEGEYTLDTLPEYQPKGYGAELLACQTQLQRFRTESERKTYCEDFRPTMRMTTNGMVSKFEQEIDGVTYYFASAEL